MRGLICLLLLAGFMAACRNEPDKKVKEKKATAAKEEATPVKSGEKLLVLPWAATFNPQTQKMELKYNASTHAAGLTIQDMIDAINLKYPQIVLQEDYKSNDTLFVRINDATYLTQQIGSEGATAYLAEATFALTELKGIHAVDFAFREGDHAVPKTYTRESFKDFN